MLPQLYAHPDIHYPSYKPTPIYATPSYKPTPIYTTLVINPPRYTLPQL